MLSDDKLREIVMDLMKEADYDLYKSLVPETAEDPEAAEERVNDLKEILRKHLTKQKT
jgi:hypothetical protein